MVRREWSLPEGVTIEQIDALVIERERANRRKWAERNPDKILKQREKTYSNFLTKRGFKVIPPTDGGLIDG